MSWQLQKLPYPNDLETKKVLKMLPEAHRALAELKGFAKSIPQQSILINTLILQEAKDSSEVENIVTTHDELYKATIELGKVISSETKEVRNYVAALKRGFDLIAPDKILTEDHIKEIQSVLEKNSAGYRTLPGTNLKNQRTGEIIYTPPQDNMEIILFMQNLEKFINDEDLLHYDDIIKMALFHFQFESIHPFYDGNGRTGRIINILYLIIKGLLDIPILYLSKYIIQNKTQYYLYLQDVRKSLNWEDYLCYMIKAVEYTAKDTLTKVVNIKDAMANFKIILRNNYSFYSQDLLNHLFKHPYTKIEYLQDELKVSRITAASYLNQLSQDGHLEKQKMGKYNYYINKYLTEVLSS